MYRKSRQEGLATVEFALVGGLFFFMMFGAIEVSRLMFTMSALDAMTQRGARLAAVCPINDATVKDVAAFGGDIVAGVTADNIAVRYLTENGNPTTSLSDTRFVEVSITGYEHQMLIPATIANFIAPSVEAPAFTTLRPAESLGLHPGSADYC